MLIKDSKCQIKAKWWPLFQRPLILGKKLLTIFQQNDKNIMDFKSPEDGF